MASKFYAVKFGRTPGVYKTWKECEEQTKGFKGAIFKSFATHGEALTFVTPVAFNGLGINADQCVIYTDGSHQRGKKYLGIGAYCQYQGVEYKMSLQCDDKMLSSYGITETACSNPTAEFLAVAEVLRELNRSPLPFRSNITITFMNDYIGPANWIAGNWKANEIHIQNILKECRILIKNINVPVYFQHVKGHSGDHGNDQADKLASDHEVHSNFSALFLKLQ